MKAELDVAWQERAARLHVGHNIAAADVLWLDAVRTLIPDATFKWSRADPHTACCTTCTVNNIMVFLPPEVLDES